LIRKSDVIHCNDLNTLPVGALIKLVRFGRVKVVYDAHEYEINQKPGQSKSSIKLLFFIESLFIRFANRVITVSDSIANEYQRLYKIQKPELVRNCPPYTAAKSTDIFRETFSLRPDQRIFLYQGGLTAGRGLSDLLTLFKSYNDDSKVLVCMGYGALDISVKKASDLCDTIFYHPAVKPDVLLSYTGSADFGISFIEDSCLSYRYCLPNKMFEYFMAGLPVIVSNLPEMRKFVLETEAGFVTSQNNLQGLSEAVDLAMNCDYPKVKANALAVSTLNCWEVEELVLIKVYRELF
ncbi:hypothetical protein A3750_06470, partial [Oleiphilus sp. HI0079]